MRVFRPVAAPLPVSLAPCACRRLAPRARARARAAALVPIRRPQPRQLLQLLQCAPRVWQAERRRGRLPLPAAAAGLLRILLLLMVRAD